MGLPGLQVRMAEVGERHAGQRPADPPTPAWSRPAKNPDSSAIAPNDIASEAITIATHSRMRARSASFRLENARRAHAARPAQCEPFERVTASARPARRDARGGRQLVDRVPQVPCEVSSRLSAS